MISDQARKSIAGELKNIEEVLVEQFEIAGLSSMKISIDITKGLDPKCSIKIDLVKRDGFYFEKGKIVEPQQGGENE